MVRYSMKPHFLVPVLVLLVSMYVIVLGNQRNDLIIQNNGLKTELESAKANGDYLKGQVASLEDANYNLQQALDAQNNQVDLLSRQVFNLTGSVTLLTKLTTIDPELLKKYSKVYFLSENYKPRSLFTLDPRYTFDPKKTEQVLGGIQPYLISMLNDASAAGIDLKVLSAYRSFETQQELKTSYRVTYGSGANAFSAEQGYSEHQLGTAVDFSSSKTASTAQPSSVFEKTDTYKWLQENAHKYGFVLSYPKGNAYYIFEPWHWRFVGRQLALSVHDSGKSFYAFDQREIDAFLVQFFD